MRRVDLESSSLRSAGYDGGAHVLEVEFTGGGVYRYREVPAAVFAQLLQAPSAGRFLTHFIRGRYPYARVPRTA